MDEAQFQQLVVNLCTNAWQALIDERGQMTVSLERLALAAADAHALQLAAGDYAALTVVDNGRGMAEAVRSRIFEPFFTTKPIGQGTGLGLAVVRSVVSDSGGSIQVQSKPGQGTRITVYLPLSPEPSVETPLAPGASLPPVAPVAGRVLYIDDDEVVSLTVAALLGKAGFDVTCAASGYEALSQLHDAAGRFQVVVTDFNMPGMSGLVVAKTVLRHVPAPRVIITSGYITDELRTRASQLGITEALAVRAFEERIMLLRQTAEVATKGNAPSDAARLSALADDSEARLAPLLKIVLDERFFQSPG